MKPTSPRWCAFALNLLLTFTLAPRLARAQQTTAPTPDEAKRFIERAEQELADLELKASRAAWVQVNFITFDTENIASDAEEAANTAATKYAKLAHRYDNVSLSPELGRKRLLLEHATQFPAPDDPKAQKELAVPRRRGKILPRYHGNRTLASHEPRSGGVKARMDWLACRRCANARSLRANGGTRQCRVA
jgi:hypothetical protein